MSAPGDDRDRARVVALAGRERAAAAGLTLPADLRIWALADLSPSDAAPAPAPAPEVRSEADRDGVAPGPTFAQAARPEAGGAGSAPGRRSAAGAQAEAGGDGVAPGRRSAAGAQAEAGRYGALSGRGSGELAEVLEQATPAAQRQSHGLHVTPAWLADDLVARSLARSPEPGPTVCDPACGGGAFLLAAARALEAHGLSRAEVVGERLWGADVDPVGLAAAELALTLWAGEPPPPDRLVEGDALAGVASSWPAAPDEGFGMVVGNPPFLNQLERATVRSAATTERLRARFGDVVQAYTDAAWLFLVLGCDLVRPGGVVTMVQPLSVVAARDGAAVRAALGARADLCDLWVEDRPRRTFAASVHVCAPVLVTGKTGHAGAAAGGSEVDRVWADRLADAVGVPGVAVGAGSAGRLGDRAEVAAGFRDEYYGLIPLVREAADRPDGDRAPLVTTGVLDWGRCAWGERPVRFARRSWAAPVIDLSAVDDLDPAAPTTRGVRRWLARTGGPKLLVANQTRVVELAVDVEGTWVPSVPTLAVVPPQPEDLWLLAAAAASPTATAWLWRRAPGTALHRDALKVAAGHLAALPLPVDEGAWQEAATALEGFVTHHDADAFEAYVTAAAAAYRSPPDLVAWWRARLPGTGA